MSDFEKHAIEIMQEARAHWRGIRNKLLGEWIASIMLNEISDLDFETGNG